MSLRTRAIVVTVLAAAASGALAVPATAASLPWESSTTPTVIAHHATPTAARDSGTLTALCSASCYE